MDIWHYDPATGEFRGHGTADADPLDAENWLIPAHASAIAPEQSPAAGEALVFDPAGHWLTVPDHRGETWFDAEGNAVKIDVLGDPAALGLLSEAPPKPITNDQVNAERERRIAAGAAVAIGERTFSLQTDPTSIRNIQGVGTAATARLVMGDSVTLTTFRDADDVDQQLTPSEALSMAMQVAAHVDAIYKASWALKALDPIPADFADNSYWP